MSDEAFQSASTELAAAKREFIAAQSRLIAAERRYWDAARASLYGKAIAAMNNMPIDGTTP